jgi:chaperonin GroEL
MPELRRLVFQPETYQGLQRGMNQIVEAVRPTLGPRARTVAIAPIVGKGRPELLDNGGIIARRIIQLPDRDEDVGAMLTRQMLWQLQEDVGDGTATAAVLFQSIFNQGVRYVAAGGSPVRLRAALENGLRAILAALDAMTIPVEGPASLAGVARSISHDPQLAQALGEIFDVLGENGHLEIQSGRGRDYGHDYVDGTYWMQSGVFSPSMLTAEGNIQLENAAILISDLDIDDPYQLATPMRAALQAESRALVIVARSLSEKVTGFLATNRHTDRFHAIAVKTPGVQVDDQAFALEDLAVLTGGRALVRAAGQTLDSLEPDDLGYARRAWASRTHLGIIGGKGDSRRRRQQIASLSASLGDDMEKRKKTRQRIGRLMNGSVTLRTGGATETEIKFRKEVAERAAEALRGAVAEGVLPGGGTAFIACIPALQGLLDQTSDDDERAAYRILIQALREPFRTILANAGYDPSEILAEIGDAPCGFDVETGRVVDMAQAGIYDIATAQKAAVKAAVMTASLALTIDVLAHRKRQREALAPHEDAR